MLQKVQNIFFFLRLTFWREPCISLSVNDINIPCLIFLALGYKDNYHFFRRAQNTMLRINASDDDREVLIEHDFVTPHFQNPEVDIPLVELFLSWFSLSFFICRWLLGQFLGDSVIISCAMVRLVLMIIGKILKRLNLLVYMFSQIIMNTWISKMMKTIL